MKIQYAVSSIAVALALASVGFSATIPNTSGVSTELVITARPAKGTGQPPRIEAGDLKILQGSARVPLVRLERLEGSLADMQLFVLLDDSTRSSSLGTQLPQLKTFIRSLPAATQVAVGYMRNGSSAIAQPFTADHEKAANALRLPMSIPGGNGSPYFALSDLMKHWPSQEATGRRVVLMLTDGVDRYDGTVDTEDPYVVSAIQDSLKEGALVYSIYLRGAGLYGRGAWATDFAQSRLIDVSQETGGHAYFQDFSDPVSISPFLYDLQDRLENQYRATIEDLSGKGVQSVKLRTEAPGLKVEGPTRIYVQ